MHKPDLALDIFNTNTSYPKYQTTAADQIPKTPDNKSGQVNSAGNFNILPTSQPQEPKVS